MFAEGELAACGGGVRLEVDARALFSGFFAGASPPVEERKIPNATSAAIMSAPTTHTSGFESGLGAFRSTRR